MGGGQVDGGKGCLEDREMMEVLAQGDLDSLWQPGSEGTGLALEGATNPTSLALSPVVQKGCAPTGAGRRGAPAGHKQDRGQTLRALPHISASMGHISPGASDKARDKHSKTDFSPAAHMGAAQEFVI